MPWLQVRLAITPEQAPELEDQLLELGAVSVTFMDAEDQPPCMWLEMPSTAPQSDSIAPSKPQ